MKILRAGLAYSLIAIGIYLATNLRLGALEDPTTKPPAQALKEGTGPGQKASDKSGYSSPPQPIVAESRAETALPTKLPIQVVSIFQSGVSLVTLPPQEAEEGQSAHQPEFLGFTQPPVPITGRTTPSLSNRAPTELLVTLPPLPASNER